MPLLSCRYMSFCTPELCGWYGLLSLAHLPTQISGGCWDVGIKKSALPGPRASAPPPVIPTGKRSCNAPLGENGKPESVTRLVCPAVLSFSCQPPRLLHG